MAIGVMWWGVAGGRSSHPVTEEFQDAELQSCRSCDCCSWRTMRKSGSTFAVLAQVKLHVKEIAMSRTRMTFCAGRTSMSVNSCDIPELAT